MLSLLTMASRTARLHASLAGANPAAFLAPSQLRMTSLHALALQLVVLTLASMMLSCEQLL